MESIVNKFTRAISYTFIGSVVARLCGVLIGVLVARVLGSSSLGLYAIVQSTIGLFATFFGLGLGLTATKMIAQHYINSSEVIGRILGLLFLALVLSIVFGSSIYLWSLPIIVKNIYSIPNLMPLLRIGLFWFSFLTLGQFLEAVLIGFQAFRSQMVVNSALSLFNLILILIAVLINKNNILQNLIIAGSITAFAQSILLLIYVSKELIKFNTKLSLSNLKSLIQPVLFDFSTPAFIGKIMEQPLNWVSILLLVKLGSGISNVGGLNVINNIKAWILYFPAMLVTILVPILTDIYHTKEKDIFQRTLVLNQKFLWLATLPVLVFLVTVIRLLIKLLFGDSYSEFWHSGALLLAWAILIPINEINDRAMISVGKMWLSLGFRVIYMMLLLLTLILFVPKFQLSGYVFATGISYLVYVFIQTCWLRKLAPGESGTILKLSMFSLFILFIAYCAAQFFIGYKSILYGLLLFIFTVIFEWKYLIGVEEKKIALKIINKVTTKN